MPTHTAGPVSKIHWKTTPSGITYGYVYYHETVWKKYTAGVCSIRCLDDNTWKTFKNHLREFLRLLGMSNIDPITLAGGGLNISSPEVPSDCDLMLRNIAISVREHGARRVKIFNHHACAFAGGFQRFNYDPDAEFEYHARELMRAHEIVKNAFPEIDIQLHFINPKGTIRVLPNPSLVRL